MVSVSFEWVLENDLHGFIVGPGSNYENKGYYTNMHVDRRTIPKGWYVYDIRHDDAWKLSTIENKVIENHAGTFLTQTPLKLNKNGYRCLDRGYRYMFI